MINGCDGGFNADCNEGIKTLEVDTRTFNEAIKKREVEIRTFTRDRIIGALESFKNVKKIAREEVIESIGLMLDGYSLKLEASFTFQANEISVAQETLKKGLVILQQLKDERVKNENK